MNRNESLDSMVHSQVESRGNFNASLLNALRKVPREQFIPKVERVKAYTDGPVSIGSGQTISQPYIVAYMTQALALSKILKVLEIGTGSGYQTAILSELAGNVFTVERISVLQDRAKRIHRSLGYTNVQYLHGDGFLGWKKFAPYDRIIITASPPAVPQELLKQLDTSGILVSPVGVQGSPQQLVKITREGNIFRRDDLMSVLFVPMKPGIG